MTTTVLIDGDVIAFQSSAAVEQAICWDEEGDGNMWSLHADLGRAIDLWQSKIAEIVKIAEGKRTRIALSDSQNFRREVLPTYKANRKGSRKPVCYVGLLRWIEENYRDADVVRLPKLEADDVLGIWATRPKSPTTRRVVVTIDKDLKQVPGWHLNPDKLDEELVYVDESQGARWHLMQTLTGDSTDGYSGCPGVGQKTAEKILVEGTWAEVVAAYAAKGLSEDWALTMARVAKILDYNHWNHRKQEVRLWQPSS